jgi:Tfp pilus assembly protein PilF
MRKAVVFLLLIGGCSANTARYVDTNRNEVALVSTDANESLHAQAIKKGAADSAIQKLITAIANPAQEAGKVDALLELAKLQLAKGDLAAAEKSVKNQDSKLILAQVYYRKGLFDMALMLLQDEKMTNFRGSEMNNLLALINYKRGFPALAWIQFEEAIRLDQTNFAARLNYGMLLLEHSLDRRAGVQFEKTLSLIPNQPDALLMMAMIKARRGEFEAAEKDLEDLKSSHKNNVAVLFNYGSVLFAEEKYKEAMNSLKQYLSSKSEVLPNSETAISMIQNSQDRLKELEEIETELANNEKKPKEVKKEAKTSKSNLEKSDSKTLDDLISH